MDKTNRNSFLIEDDQTGKGFNYANFGLRLGATLIDVFIVIAFIIIVLRIAVPLLQTSNPEFEEINDIWKIGFVFLFLLGPYTFSVLYRSIFECSPFQGTPGKMAIGIKVVGYDGNRISFLRSLGRNLSKILSGLLMYMGYFMVLFSNKKQALHDNMASTYVIKEEHDFSAYKQWKWPFLGTLAFLLLLPSFLEKPKNEIGTDYRQGFFQEDINSMVSNPTPETDSISYSLMSFFNELTSEDMDVSKMEYFSKIVDKKILVLIRFPDIDMLSKEDQEFTLNTMYDLLDMEDKLDGYDKYLVLFNRNKIKGIKTPSFNKVAYSLQKTPIYEFYGEADPVDQNGLKIDSLPQTIGDDEK